MARGKYEKNNKEKKVLDGSADTAEAKKGKLWVKILTGLLVVVLVVGLLGYGAFRYVVSRLGRFDDPANDAVKATDEFDYTATIDGQETIPTVAVTDVTFQQVEELQGEKVVNVMLIGEDSRPGEGRSRSDTMILVSLNREKNTVQLTSFMRDLYVQIPGYLDNRLNVAYRYGGVELMNETFLLNFGLKIDGNVMVNFEEFSKIIDMLGGVDIELTEEESDYLVYQKGHEGLVPGWNHLSGEEALDYTRMRYVSGGDYRRTERQRKVLSAVATSFMNSDLSVILSLVNEILPHVVTNLTDEQILDYVTAGVAALASGAEIESLRIPADDAHYGAMIEGMSVLVPDLAMCREDLADFLYSEEME